MPSEGTPAGFRGRWRGRGHGATGTKQSPSPRPAACEPRAPRGRGPPPALRAGCSPLLSSSPSFLPARPALPLPASFNPFARARQPRIPRTLCAPLRGCAPPGPQPTPRRSVCAVEPKGRREGERAQQGESRGEGLGQRPRSAHTKAAMALCCALSGSAAAGRASAGTMAAPQARVGSGMVPCGGTGTGLRGLDRAGGAHVLCPRHQALPAAPVPPPAPQHNKGERAGSSSPCGAHPGTAEPQEGCEARSRSVPPRGALPAPGGH